MAYYIHLHITKLVIVVVRQYVDFKIEISSLLRFLRSSLLNR